MRLYYNFLCFTIATTCLLLQNLNAMSQPATFEKVYSILKSNCSSCHNSGNMDFTLTKETVYENLVGKTPLNATAAAKGNKIIDAGYPENSFLFRKINAGLYSSCNLQNNEGNDMPKNLSPLAPHDIELVRQWIMYGAPLQDSIANTALIHDFYNGNGLPRITPLPPPPANEGFQIYFGTLFLQPQQELEIHKKIPTYLPDSVEVNRIEIAMDGSSHHFAMYKYLPNTANTFTNGITTVYGIFDAALYFINTSFLVTSQYPYNNYVLPQGTAFTFEDSTYIDINYHVKNYSNVGILPTELYINVYTQPKGTAEREMLATPAYYGGDNPFLLQLAPTATDTIITMHQFDPQSTETWDIWALHAHTHQWGKDFDIYLRNPDGTKGEQIYEGFYNTDYTVNQGYYDWSHPALRRFDPMISVDMKNGLLHEAVFNNDSGAPISFGLTTKDEMFVTYMLYTIKKNTQVNNNKPTVAQKITVLAYPNPTTQQLNIAYNLQQNAPQPVTINLYNTLGQKIICLQNNNIENKGLQKHVFDVQHLPKGAYLLKIETNEGINTQKVFIF